MILNLKNTLDEVSYRFITKTFKLKYYDDSIVGDEINNQYNGVKFFNNGRAFYTCGGSLNKEQLWFDSHQDCVDFIRIK